MIRVGLVRALAAAALLGAALPALSASPASADPEEGMLISLDGTHFSRHPQGSVFPAGLTLVPGSTATGQIHVRNVSGMAGELQLAVTGASASKLSFIESLSMLAWTPASPAGTPVPLTLGDVCAPLFAGELVEPGQTTTVTVALTMDASVGNAEQGSTADTRLQVSLRQPDAPDIAVPDCDSGDGVPVTASDDTDAEPVDDTSTGGSESVATRAPTSPASGEPAAPGAPSADTPSGGAPATAGSGQLGVLFPWMGVSALVTGAVIFLVAARKRKRQEHE